MSTSVPAVRGKIVFVNRYFHPDESATSQLLTDLATRVSTAGYEVHVVCSRQRYDDAAVRLIGREIIQGVQVHRVWTTRFGRDGLAGRALDYASFYLSSASTLLWLVHRADTVVAETDPPLMSIVAAVVIKLKAAGLVNWLQDIFPEVASGISANLFPEFFSRLVRRCRNWSLSAARTNVVIGARMREALAGMGVAPDRIQVIPNWAHAPAAPKTPQQSALRARLGFTSEFVVGYSGNLGRAHEYGTVIEAAESLRANSMIVFLMIGGGAGMARLKGDVAQRRLPNFRFLPYQPRQSLSDSLAAADVHWVSLLPALEGFIVPSKYYGILAAARPVVFIGDPDGELARDIRDGGGGTVLTVGNSLGLAQLVSRWAIDRSECEQMGRCAYERYVHLFTMNAALGRWLRLLDPGLTSQRAPPRQLIGGQHDHAAAKVSGADAAMRE